MAKLTREEVIARVREGKSLAEENLPGLDLGRANLIGAYLFRANMSGADLSEAYLIGAYLIGANLSKANLGGANLFRADLSGAHLGRADLSKANLSGANLSGADLSGADLIVANLDRANLRESNLNAANFEGADLSMADLTGANIYNIATAGWKIDGVKCEYVYNCKNYTAGIDEEEKEKTRRNFAPGEFEQLYKSFPKLELIFKKEFSHLDHRALLAIIDRINEELPAVNLKLRKLEKVVDTTATLTAETKEAVEEIAKVLPVQYANLIVPC